MYHSKKNRILMKMEKLHSALLQRYGSPLEHKFKNKHSSMFTEYTQSYTHSKFHLYLLRHKC